MAEEVKIEGGDLNGSILENAASEATLQELLKLLQKQTDGNKAKASEATLKKLLKAMDKNATGADEDLEAFNRTLGQVNDKSKKLNDTFASIAGMGVGLLFSGISAAGSSLLDFFTDSLSAFRQTSAVGASFNNSLVDLRIAAAEAAMPLDDFVKNIQENSKLLSTLGGTVTEGAKRFGTLSKQLRTGDIGKQLLSMGFNVGDINDGMLNFMTIQESMGRLDKNNTQGLVKGTQEYLVELDKMSKATGISRKALEDEAAKASIDPIIEQMMEGADPAKVAANMAMVTEVGGKRLQDALKEVATGVVKSDLGKRLVGLGVTTEQATDVFSGADPSKVQGFLVGLGKTIEGEGVLRNKALMQAREDFAVQGSIALKARILAKKDLKQAAEEQEKRNKLTGALSVIGQLFTSIQSEITLSLLDSGVFQMVADGIAELGRLLVLYSPQITKAIKDIISYFDEGIKNFFSDIDTGGLGSAILNLFKKLFVNIASGIGTLIKESFTGLFSKGLTKDQAETKKTQESKIRQNKQLISDLQGDMKSNKDLQANPELMKVYEKEINTLTGETDKLIESNKKLNETASATDWTFVAEAIAGVSAAMYAFNGVSKLLSIGLQSLIPGGKAFETLSQSLSKGLLSFTPAIPVILSFGAAIGVGAGGLGYALQGVASIIEQTANAFEKFPTSIKKFEDLDVEKLKKMGPILEMFSGSGKGLLAGAGNALETWSKGSASEAFANSFNAIASIDVNKLDNIATGISKIKTVIGQDFGKQAEGVKTFTESINELIEKLKNLEDTLKNTTGAKELLNTKTATAGSAASTSTIAGTANTEQQNQLNKLVEQLLLVTQEMNTTNKDILSATKGRGNPI